MNETTDGELNFLLKDIPDFHGCHNKDLKQIKNGYTIINLNGSSHWTAIARNGNEFFYMDSYAVVAPQHIADLMKDYVYNTKCLQAINSSSCGFYCVAFIRYMHKHGNDLHSFNEFLDHFTDKYQKNELVLKNLLK